MQPEESSHRDYHQRTGDEVDEHHQVPVDLQQGQGAFENNDGATGYASTGTNSTNEGVPFGSGGTGYDETLGTGQGQGTTGAGYETGAGKGQSTVADDYGGGVDESEYGHAVGAGHGYDAPGNGYDELGASKPGYGGTAAADAGQDDGTPGNDYGGGGATKPGYGDTAAAEAGQDYGASNNNHGEGAAAKSGYGNLVEVEPPSLAAGQGYVITSTSAGRGAAGSAGGPARPRYATVAVVTAGTGEGHGLSGTPDPDYSRTTGGGIVGNTGYGEPGARPTMAEKITGLVPGTQANREKKAALTANAPNTAGQVHQTY